MRELAVRIDPPHPHPPPLPAALDGFDLVTAFLSGRKATTLRAYGRDLADFARFLGAASTRAAVGLLLLGSGGQANQIALAYRADLLNRGLASATVARRLAALRSMVKLAKTLGQVAWTIEVAAPRAEPLRDTAGPGVDGWRAVLDLVKAAAATGSALGIRNVLIVRALHDLGLRRGELAAVDLADVDLEGGTVAIVGKGRTDPVRLTLPDPVRRALAAWLAVRGLEPGPLLLRLDRAAGPGERLAADGIHELVGALGRRAGLARPLAPHKLRHAAITRVLDRSGGNVRAAQRFSRHRDLRTLALYDDNREDLGGQMARLISED